MNAVSEVSMAPKNTPTPSMPTTTISSRGRNSSETREVARPSTPRCVDTCAAVGCSAKAPTNTRMSTAAITSGIHGATAVASTPTRNGPNTNTVSSAADSYDIVDDVVRARRSAGTRSAMIVTSRDRDIGETCGAVAPIAKALSSTSGSGAGE